MGQKRLKQLVVNMEKSESRQETHNLHQLKCVLDQNLKMQN